MSKSRFCIPSSCKTGKYRPRPKSKVCCEISHASLDSIHSVDSIESGITCLHELRRPLAVLWAVMAIVIDAFKCHAWRLFTHVLKKLCVVKPSFADLDSTTSIVVETFKVFVHASPLHCTPQSIRPCGRKSMLSKLFDMDLMAQTTARLCCPGVKAGNNNIQLFPAYTSAPHTSRWIPLPLSLKRSRYYSESPICGFDRLCLHGSISL